MARCISRARVSRCALLVTLIAGLAGPRSVSAETLRAPADSTAGAAELLGTITDSLSAAPLAGAEVVITRGKRVVGEVMTGEFGRFIVRNVPAGRYRVEARLIGYRDAERDITVGPGSKAVRVNLTMVSAPVSIGTTTDSVSPPS